MNLLSIYQKNLLSFNKNIKKHNRLTKIEGKVKRKKKRKVSETKKREGKNNYKKYIRNGFFFFNLKYN